MFAKTNVTQDGLDYIALLGVESYLRHPYISELAYCFLRALIGQAMKYLHPAEFKIDFLQNKSKIVYFIY